MSIRTNILGLVDVLMRVPPLLVIDEIFRISMGLQSTSMAPTAFTFNDAFYERNENYTGSLQNTLAEDKLNSQRKYSIINRVYDPQLYLSLTTAKFLICLFGCASAASIFMLWTRHLVIVYMFIISVVLIFLSYWSNVAALGIIEASGTSCLLEDFLSLNVNRLLAPTGVAVSILPHIIAQWFMGFLFAYIHLGPRNVYVQKLLPFCFLMPLILAALPLPVGTLKHIPVFAAIVPLILTKISLWSNFMDVCKVIYNGHNYARTFAFNFGLSAFVENEWQRLNVPNVLRAFWTIRIAYQLFLLMIGSEASLSVLSTIQKLLVNGCETLTAVLGMTSILSIICHYIGRFFHVFLMSDDFDEDKSIGTISAILFYILALQTSLTSLSPEKRFICLCRNLCLLVTAVLHFLHHIVSPILMSLSAARNPSKKRHARALSVCVFLLIVPIALLTVLCTKYSPSTWLLAVAGFSVGVIIKVLVSLATYTLFLVDARRQYFWEKLDDYVYYIRAFGNCVEFGFGIFLFFNGAWVLVFESGGAVRVLIMCIHAYYNIWCEGRCGCSVFMKRRAAVHKISRLPEATPDQLRAFDDVCAICYQEMSSAKMTRCKHLFHGVCLRKCLYVQDRCPLCHEIMLYQEKPLKPADGVSQPIFDNGENSQQNPPQREQTNLNSIEDLQDSVNQNSVEHAIGSSESRVLTVVPSPSRDSLNEYLPTELI